MSITFRYMESPNPDGTFYKRPCIPITFSNGAEKIEQIALIDSGADVCAMDYRRALKFGLDLSGQRIKSYGVTGSIDSVITNVQIDVSRGHEHYSFQIPIRILFSDSNRIIHTLIGRKGFFDKFRITIDEANQRITLKRNNHE